MSSFTKGTHSQIHQQGARKKKSIQPFYCKFQPAIIPADLTAARPWKAASTPTNWQGHSHLFIYLFSLFNLCQKPRDCEMDGRSKGLTKVVWSESASHEPEGSQVENNRRKCGMQEAGERRETARWCKEGMFFLMSMGRAVQLEFTCRQVWVWLTHLAFVFGAVAQMNHRTWMGFCRSAKERERGREGGGSQGGWAGGNKVRILFCCFQSQLDAPAHRTRNQIVAHQFCNAKGFFPPPHHFLCLFYTATQNKL